MAEIAVRTRRDAMANPLAQVSGDFDVDELLADRLRHAPRCGRHDLPPITDGACAVVIARGDKARELQRQPDLDHRPGPLLGAALPGHARPPHLERGRPAAKAAGLDEAPGRGGRAPGLVHPRGAAAGRGARPRARRGDQPVGRPAGRQPDHGHRPGPDHRGGPARSGRGPTPGGRVGPLVVGPVPATEPGLHHGRATTDGSSTVRDRRHRPDPPQEPPLGRVPRRAGP